MTNIKGPVGASFKNNYFGGNVHLENVTSVQKTIHQYLPPQTTASHLPESWNVPQRNLKFTGRIEKLREIDQRFNQPNASIVACVGLGGVGKTSLVLEYVYRNLNAYSGGIAWFSSYNKNSLVREFIGLGVQLGVIIQSNYRDSNNQQPSDDDDVKVLKTWLEDSRRSGWLLIFDNVENYDDVCHLFPNKGGKIIVTSRYQIWDNVIVVNAFERFESIEYFKKVCPKRASDDEWSELADILGDLPLALDQASAYLRENETVSLADYITTYWSKKKIFLSSNKLENYNKIPVYLTWNITMEKIKETSPLAVKLLYALSFLAPDDIPHNIFEDFADIFVSSREDSLNFEEMFGILHRYSLISYNSEKRTSTMHSLLQEVLRLKVAEEAHADLLTKTTVLFVLWLKKNLQSLVSQRAIFQLVPHLVSFVKYISDFLRQNPRNDKLRNRSGQLLFLYGEICYYSKEFKDALVVTDAHLESIESRSNSNGQITLGSSCYETEIMSVIGKIKANVAGDVDMLENLVDVFEFDNKMHKMSAADVLTRILRIYSMMGDEWKVKQTLDNIRSIYQKKTLRNVTISLICQLGDKYKDKRNIVEEYETFLSSCPVGVSPLEECALYQKLKYYWHKIEHPNTETKLTLIPDIRPSISLNDVFNLNSTIEDMEKELEKMTSEDTKHSLLKISRQCTLAVFNYEIEDYKKADFYLNECENAIQTVTLKKGEWLFEALKALADAYFHTQQIIKAKATYVKSLQVATTVYDPRHFHVLKARLSVCVMSYIMNGDDSLWEEIKKFFHGPSTTDKEFMGVMTDIYLDYSCKAFQVGHETIAGQVLNDLFALNFKFYSFDVLKVQINREALRTILTNSGECRKYISRLVKKFDSANYTVHLIISETLVVFLLLCSLYGCLPGSSSATSGDNYFVLTFLWADNVEMTIIDDSLDFLNSFLGIIKLIPLRKFQLCHLLERKTKILRALGQHRRANDVFNRQIDILTRWKSFNGKLHVNQAYHLGVMYADLGLLRDAKEKLISALEKSLNYYGPFHQIPATISYYLGTVYLELDCWNHAKAYFSFCLITESQLNKGEDLMVGTEMRIETLKLFVHEYDSYAHSNDKKKKAMTMLLMRHRKPLYLENFKENCHFVELVRYVTESAVRLYIKGCYNGAVFLVQELGSMLRLFHKMNNLEVADSLIAVADVSMCIEASKIATIYLQDALKMYSNVHGQDHQKIKEIHFKLGSVFTCLNNFSEAYKSFVKGLSTEEDRTTLCWSLLRLGRLFWLLDKNSYIPLRTLFGRKAISDLWQPITNRQKLNHLKCCDKELGAFWAALQSNVYKHKKIFGQLNRELILSELEVCKKSNTPFNSPKINYFLFLIANSCEEYHRTSRNIRTKSLQSCLKMLINYTVQQILTNALFLFTH